MRNCFYPADILLPDFKEIDGTRWACIACDQFTSEIDYWNDAEKTVGDAPSTLRLILPEMNARLVNSPASACLQPAARHAESTLSVISTPP